MSRDLNKKEKIVPVKLFSVYTMPIPTIILEEDRAVIPFLLICPTVLITLPFTLIAEI